MEQFSVVVEPMPLEAESPRETEFDLCMEKLKMGHLIEVIC